MAEVSIIVPVYQVEQYIRQCVDSILAQTFSDFELILVDDGSKDRSGMICDEYGALDPRVRVIHKENGGLSDARNRGMDQMSGNFFLFVDSDDYIAPNMVECLYRRIQDTHADIAACNFLYDFQENPEKNFTTAIAAEVIPGSEIFYHRKNDRSYGFWTVVWNKLYKTATFGKVRFPVGKLHEDEFWANDIYRLPIQVATTPLCLYCYRQRPGSVMHNDSAKKELDMLEALQARIDVYLQDGQYAPQSYRVLIYSLEYLEKSRKQVKSGEEKALYLQAEKRAKSTISRLKKSKLSFAQHISLLPMGMDPCLVFSVGIRFRGLLERFL